MQRLAKLAFCAATALLGAGTAQAQAKPLPAYTPAYEPRSVDERGLWMDADEAERVIRNSPLLVKDSALKQYVRDVLCETVGEDRCGGVRIYILEAPFFNAGMYPNGMMVVNTGALLRLRDSAQLASLLGHEFGHFELRHSLEGFKQRRTATDIRAWVMVAGGLTGTNMADTVNLLTGGMYQFSRQQETAADLLGLDYLGQSAFPSNSAALVWQQLMQEQDATAAGRKQKAKHSYRSGFFDTHPTELSRATYLAEAARKIGDGADDPGRDRHRQALAPILPRLLAAQTKRNDFGGTEYLLASLAEGYGWTPDLLFARGEMYRARGNPRDLVTASDLYREALAKGYTAPDIHRSLGLALMRSGEGAEGSTQLREYLRLAPDASDRDLIQTLVAQ